MIIITGTQRSGTSFMASFLKACGYDLGTEFWDKRIDGGLESPHICNFFRDYLGDNSFPFTKYWDMIKERTFDSFHNLHKKYKVSKFSYLLMVPEFVDLWYSSRGRQDMFLVMDRSIGSVSQSKSKRKEFYEEDWKGLNLTSKEILNNKVFSLAKMDYYGMSYFKIPFPPQTTGNYTIGSLQRVFNLELPDNVQEIWNKVYKPSKIHYRK